MASCLEYTEDFTGAVAELQRALAIAKSAGLSDIQMDILALLEKTMPRWAMMRPRGSMP